jgi:hypothetical protein
MLSNIWDFRNSAQMENLLKLNGHGQYEMISFSVDSELILGFYDRSAVFVLDRDAFAENSDWNKNLEANRFDTFKVFTKINDRHALQCFNSSC